MKNFFLVILIFFVVSSSQAQPKYTFENHTQRSYTIYNTDHEGYQLIGQYDFHKLNNKNFCNLSIQLNPSCFYHYQFNFLKKELNFKTIPGDMFYGNRTNNSSKYFFHRNLGEIITNGYNFIFEDRFNLNINSNIVFLGQSFFINNARFVDILPQNQDSFTFITLGTYMQPIKEGSPASRSLGDASTFNLITLIRNSITTHAGLVSLLKSDTIFRARDYSKHIKNNFIGFNEFISYFTPLTNITFSKKSPIDFKKDYYYALFTFWANKCVFVNDSNGMYLRDTMTYLYDTFPTKTYNRPICFATNADGYYQVISDNQIHDLYNKDQQFDFFKLTKDADSLKFIKTIYQKNNFLTKYAGSQRGVLSSTGRYMYFWKGTNLPRYNPDGSLDSLYPKSLTYANVRESKIELYQMDLSALFNHNIEKVHKIAKFQKPGRYFNFHLQPIAGDGNIYFTLDEMDTSYVWGAHAASQHPEEEWNTGIRNIQLYKLSNADSFGIDSQSITKVADSLLFPLRYPQVDIYNSETWEPFPFKVKYNKPDCSNFTSYAALESTLLYDSLGWEMVGENAPNSKIYKTDTFIYPVTQKTRVRCFVWWGGWENIVYGWIYPLVFVAQPEYDSLVTREISVCEGESYEVKLLNDSVSTGFEWFDGSTDSTRIFSDSGTYTLKVYYNKCIRVDTITISYYPKTSHKIDSLTLCNNDLGWLSIDGDLSGAEIRWSDGSTTNPKIVSEPGNYCATITDTTGCEQEVCGYVNFIRDAKPTWARDYDTLICEGDTLFIADTSLYYTQPGTYQLGYGSFEICSDNYATIRLDFKLEENCDPRVCEWYIPNAFTPQQDMKNEVWQPINACEGTGYCIKMYNRWGQLIFDRCNTPFDGTNIPEGIYLYTLELSSPKNPKREYKSGLVHLLR